MRFQDDKVLADFNSRYPNISPEWKALFYFIMTVRKLALHSNPIGINDWE